MSTDTNDARPEHGPRGEILRSAKADRLHDWSHHYRTLVLTPSAGDAPEDWLQPSYWLPVADRLGPGDIVRVMPADRSYFLELLVRDSSAQGVFVTPLRGGPLEGAFPAPGGLRSAQPPPGGTPDFRYDGPDTRWQVWEGSRLLKQGFADEAAARRWHADHVNQLRTDQARQRKKAP